MLTDPSRRKSVSGTSERPRPIRSSGVSDCTLPGYLSIGTPSAGSGVTPYTVTPGSSTTGGGFVPGAGVSSGGVCAAAGAPTISTTRRMTRAPPTGRLTSDCAVGLETLQVVGTQRQPLLVQVEHADAVQGFAHARIIPGLGRVRYAGRGPGGCPCACPSPAAPRR